MKKSLLIMLVFLTSLLISSMAIADGGTSPDCDGVESDESREVCNSYCADLECATEGTDANPKACARLSANYIKQTGEASVPCDIITCLVCGSPDPCSQQGVVGVCEEGTKAVDCTGMNLGIGVDCDDVTIPVLIEIPNSYGGGGCDNMDSIPDCQNGVPGWACTMFGLGDPIPWPDQCPAPPTCETACEADSDCEDGYICVGDICAADVTCPE